MSSVLANAVARSLPNFCRVQDRVLTSCMLLKQALDDMLVDADDTGTGQRAMGGVTKIPQLLLIGCLLFAALPGE